MMFLGDFTGLETSLDPTSMPIGVTESLTISNGIFDELYMDSDTETSYSSAIPEWGNTTILDAKFQNNILAGNTSLTLKTIDSMLIKQRKKGTYQWVTIAKIDIKTKEDLNFFFIDNLVAGETTYEYAAVPVINGSEGTYQIISVDVAFDGAFIIDNTATYQIILDLNRESLTRSNPSNIIEPANSKYPHVVYTSQSQYDTVQLSGCFIELNRDTCQFASKTGWDYRKKIRDYLTNRNTKIVKLYNGEIYMGNIVDSITENDDGHPEHVITKFTLVETGDVNNNSDLYYNGFTDFLEVGV